MRSLAWVEGIGRLTRAELLALDHAADRVPTSTTNLGTVIGFETGESFSPAIPNRAGSGAVGLIQFMPSTARALGTSPEALARMSFIQQLDYVVKYFAWFKGKNLTALEDLYLAIFWPAAIGKPDDYVIGSLGSATYRQNAGFDTAGNKDGVITRGEVCAAIRRYRATGDTRPQIEIPEPIVAEMPDVLSDEEVRQIRELQRRTTDEATEEFRRGSPLPADDDAIPPTDRNVG